MNVWTQKLVKSDSKEVRDKIKITYTLEKKKKSILEPFNIEENGHIHFQRILEASQNYDLSHNEKC